MIRTSYSTAVRFCNKQRVTSVFISIVLLLLLYNYELPQYPRAPHLNTGLSPKKNSTSSRVSDLNTRPKINASRPWTPPPHLEPPHKPETQQPSKQDAPQTSVCDAVKAWDDIVIIVKTGATEAFDKIPTQFMTTLKCAKHVLIFSDMEQDIGPYHIFDALDEVPEEVKANKDFDLYRLQQEYKAAGQDIRELNAKHEMSGAAWSLDKYKNIHMAQKTFALKPHASWYFFIDADTYIVWPTLIRWLERLDPNEPLYMGTATYLGVAFAHGGSGYILSKATISGFLEKDPDVAKKFDSRVQHDCCGDLSMAKALYETDFRLTRVWPMTQGEKPRTLPFGPSRWCQPVVTMHHVKSEEVSEIWRYEQQRPNQSEPLTYEELYRAFLEPKIQEEIDEWDNQSQSCLFKSPDVKPADGAKNRWEMTQLEKDAWKSFEDCGNACKDDRGCYQWSYYDETCALEWSFKLGEKQLPGAETKIKSGWDMEKINKFREDRPCDTPEWVVDTHPVGYRLEGSAYVETY